MSLTSRKQIKALPQIGTADGQTSPPWARFALLKRDHAKEDIDVAALSRLVTSWLSSAGSSQDLGIEVVAEDRGARRREMQ